MMQLLSGPESEMSGLGMAFKELEKKVADWNKAAVPNVTDVQNKLFVSCSEGDFGVSVWCLVSMLLWIWDGLCTVVCSTL
jgi:hypothetical protein